MKQYCTQGYLLREETDGFITCYDLRYKQDRYYVSQETTEYKDINNDLQLRLVRTQWDEDFKFSTYTKEYYRDGIKCYLTEFEGIPPLVESRPE